MKIPGAQNSNRTVFLIFLAVCLILSYSVRIAQFNKVKTMPDTYIVDGDIQMTTLDAYKWTRYAREFSEGRYTDDKNDEMMFYPDGKYRPERTPLLSVLISFTEKFTDSYYNAGAYLVLALSSLFIIPLGLFFYFAGLPWAGIGASITGSLGHIYLLRTSAGRVDTDSLNLFFVFTASLFILLAAKYKGRKGVLSACFAGAFMWLFYLWYEHSGFTVVFGAVLVFQMILYRRGIREILLYLFLYILLANPYVFYIGFINIADFAQSYFGTAGASGAQFPDVYATISEIKQKSAADILAFAATNPYTAAAGLMILPVMFLFNFKRLFAVLPVLFLGLLSFKSGGRFVIYLSPFVGAGIAYGIFVLSAFAADRVKVRRWITEAFASSVTLIIFIMIFKQSAFGFVPPASIPSETVRSMKAMGEILPRDAVIYSWWDYGLAYEDITGRATFIDGMKQRTPKTYFIAKSLTSTYASELYNTVAYLSNEGLEGINDELESGTSADAVEGVIADNSLPVEKDKYFIAYSGDMVSKFAAISAIGKFRQQNRLEPLHYRPINCTAESAWTLNCAGFKIDTRKGLINGRTPLKLMITVSDGFARSLKKYEYSDGLYLQIHADGNYIKNVYLLTRKHFYSNFNQMFMLGNYDKNRFSPVYNNFPHMRVYKVSGRK